MNVKLYFSLFVFVLWAAATVSGLALQLSPNEIDLARILTPPLDGNFLGNDDLGRPILDRLIAGAQVSFFVAVVTTLISLSTGTLIGTISGFYGGWLDRIVVRVIDIFMAFPGILLAIALAGVMGAGIENVVIALSITGWVGYARLSRAQVMSVREREHVMAAIALGIGNAAIMKRHILPLIMAPLIVEATFGFAGIIIGEAGLSFLGLGVQPPDASWGSMIRDGSQYLLIAPHMVIGPGVVLALVVLAVNLFGDWLRDTLDVKGRHD